MKRVIIESPLAHATPAGRQRNVNYARECLLDCLRRGEAPFASHLLYTQVLDDLVPGDRERGMVAGFAWGAAAELVAVYTNFGISPGMERGIERAKSAGIPIELRKLESA